MTKNDAPEMIDVGVENIDRTGFFCFMSKKKSEGYQRKLAWLKDRFAEGMRIKMLALPERGFIEYIPGEHAWRAVHADGYLLVHCLWVVGKSRGKGLATALHSTVTEFSERGAIPIALEAHLAGCTLTANEEIHTLQIVREALSNVLNHAHARQAEVRVICTSDGSVSATVTDDGIGVRQAAGAHHYGLTIMEERAKHMGGRLSIENLPALGTRVTLHFMPSSRRDGSIPIHPVQLT